ALVHPGILRRHRHWHADGRLRHAATGSGRHASALESPDRFYHVRPADHPERGRGLFAEWTAPTWPAPGDRLCGLGPLPELLLIQSRNHRAVPGQGDGRTRLHLLALDVALARAGRRLDQTDRLVLAGDGPGRANAAHRRGSPGVLLGQDPTAQRYPRRAADAAGTARTARGTCPGRPHREGAGVAVVRSEKPPTMSSP